MKPLHKISTLNLSEEDKLVIASFYENAYIPGTNDRRIQFIDGLAYYFPYGKKSPITEWGSKGWRRMWIYDYPARNKFDISMVKLNEEST